jgi:hypothetical protein
MVLGFAWHKKNQVRVSSHLFLWCGTFRLPSFWFLETGALWLLIPVYREMLYGGTQIGTGDPVENFLKGI